MWVNDVIRNEHKKTLFYFFIVIFLISFYNVFTMIVDVFFMSIKLPIKMLLFVMNNIIGNNQ